MKNFIFAASAALLTASPALSQSFQFTHEGTSFSYAYNNYDNGGSAFGQGFTYVMNATSRYDLGNNFGFQFTLGYNEEDDNGGFFGSRAFFDVNPFYKIGDGEIGVFYTVMQASGFSGDGSQFGVTGNQRYGDFRVEGYASRYDDNGTDINAVGLAAGYDINDAFGVYFAQRRDGFTSGPYNALSTIGASYELGGINSAPPITFGIEYSVFHNDGTSISDSNWDQVSFIATYEFGGDIDTSFFRGVRNRDFFFD